MVSRFLVTVNTNQLPTDELRARFKTANTGVIENFEAFLRYNAVGKEGPEWLDTITFLAVQREIGTHLGRLHLHFTVDIRHRTNIQIDTRKLTEYYTEAVGYTVDRHKAYVKVDYLKNDDDVAKAVSYVNKYSPEK